MKTSAATRSDRRVVEPGTEIEATSFPMIRRAYLVGAVVVVAVGLSWIVYDASVIPAYGDTIDYLARARTLHVDQYRTVLYPAFLRLGGVARNPDGVPSPAVVYAIQCGAMAAAAGLFAAALADALGVSGVGRRPVIFATVALVVTNPLLAHFALSLMSDSIAASSTLAFVGALGLAIGDAPPTRRRLWLGLALVCLFVMALSRIEKVYVGVLLVLVLGVRLLVRRDGVGAPFPLRRRVFVLGVLAASLAAAAIVNRATQVHDPNQAPLDFSSLAFNRVVWPRLARVHPRLSPEARGLIPLDEAARFDAHNNNAYDLLTTLRSRSADNRRIIDEITLTTFRAFPLAVIGKTLYDVGKYTLPNLAFPLERAAILPESTPTWWTVSRMEMARPRLTRVALSFADAFFLIVQLPLAIAMLVARREQRLWAHPVFWLTVAAVVGNALLFGLSSGMDAHIRYGLPAYALIHASVTLLSLLWLLPRPLPR